MRGGLALVATLLLVLLPAGAFMIAALGATQGGATGGPGSGSALAGEIPAGYRATMERAAAASCGVPWQVLAAITKVESGFASRAIGPPCRSSPAPPTSTRSA